MSVKPKGKVFVGLSGGVDSAFSAALLQKQGYEVVGVFIKTWHPEFLACNEEEERRDAMRVAAFLDIPFLSFDLEDAYKREVADYMIREYKAGRTPNPDVMCNKEVKFGAFLKKALSMGADFVATGHYARNFFLSPLTRGRLRGGEFRSTSPRPSPYKGEGATYNLQKGIDPSKDQSYFLWTLDQEQLKHILFPIGHLRKQDVRKLAKKFGLPVAEKKDSQGICFLGDIDLKEFLKHYIKEKKGKVLNEKGNEVGHHDGAVFYTFGERHGFTVTNKNPDDGPYYIVGKDIKKNILTVSQDRARKRPDLKNSKRFGLEEARNSILELENTNWISQIPKEDKTYKAQIRYHGEFLPCKVICGSKASAEVIFEKPVLVAPGQSCVIYNKDVCLGGGVVA
ncbi:tRNA 2-thiouridine(34) synthase MnmA [Candidatus Nomurabacteria bacterium]|nr:tRNA 2-thiouridine(34) synthase MnmA [Candidatus Nomurabacteria bacterium]